MVPVSPEESADTVSCVLTPPVAPQSVEWDMLLFFAAQFVMVEAAAEVGMIDMIGGWLENIIRAAPAASRTLVAVEILLWASAAISAVLVSCWGSRLLLLLFLLLLLLLLHGQEESDRPMGAKQTSDYCSTCLVAAYVRLCKPLTSPHSLWSPIIDGVNFQCSPSLHQAAVLPVCVGDLLYSAV